MDTIKILRASGMPGKAQFLNTLKMPAKDHSSRNLLVVMGIIRDLGPNDSDAAWLPRPKMEDAPVIKSPPKSKKPAEPEEPSETEQAMRFDPWAGAALIGWLASRAPVR